jgi:predicted acetyltransferase
LSVTFRYLHQDELGAVARLITHSFPHQTRTVEWWSEQLRYTLFGGGTEVLWVGEEAGKIVAACQLHRLHQWIGGAELPVMGMATVTIAPTHRRRGLAGELVASGLRAARERGDAASALYPFRASFYRKAGYGLAGEVHQYRVAPESIASGGDRTRVEMAETPAALAELRDLYRRWAVTQTGQMTRSERVWEHLLASPDHTAALVRDASGAPSGYALVTYRVDLPIPDRFLEVDEIAWLDTAARDGLLAWLGSLGDQWHQILIRALPEQRLDDFIQEPRLPVGSAPGWGLWFPSATVLRGPMFRLLDLPAAFDLRSVVPGAPVTVALDVQDTVFPENQGGWQLRLEEGHAKLERAGNDSAAEIAIRLDIEALARLYIGALTPSAALRSGRLIVERGVDRLPELDRALALPRPWTFDRF